MASPAQAVANALGGRRSLGRQVKDGEELAEAIRNGLPVASVKELAQRLRLDQAATATALGIAPRTLSRRLAQDARLTPAESDRAVRLARVFSTAVAMIGSEEKAVNWMHTANRALGGARPIEQVDTDPGAMSVEDLLGRIGYGVYS
ncbi:MAG TPA: antitoxin Xre/MbcA/ParS toxin-binding domain-containing protein [Terriglobales bacterium]|jgi:putative toxin-antitoxin system antitoxin component (TIGR02293 family)